MAKEDFKRLGYKDNNNFDNKDDSQEQSSSTKT